MHSILEIKSLALPVYIGWTEKERRKVQTIEFHVKIGFALAPECESTDHLENSVCYVKVCKRIKSLVAEKTFSLIEKLASDVFKDLKTLFPHTLIQICVHKLQPPISAVKGGVSYTCGDML